MAARMMLVGSLSMPAKIALLQRPQRSTGMNPSFLLNPNPKPERPNPVRDLGLRYPSAKARRDAVLRTSSRRFSTGSEPDRRPQWQAEYRRRLGIGDSPIVIEHRFFKPPEDGQIKINFSAGIAEDHYDDDVDGDDEGYYDPSLCTGGIVAIARNSSGDVIGVTKGSMKYTRGDKLELQMYALKAAGNLAKELRSAGMHDGPVVYESSHHAMVTAVLHPDCEGEPVPEEFLRDEYLEEVGRSCRIYCGTKDKLKEVMPDDLFDALFDALEEEKEENALACENYSTFL